MAASVSSSSCPCSFSKSSCMLFIWISYELHNCKKHKCKFTKVFFISSSKPFIKVTSIDHSLFLGRQLVTWLRPVLVAAAFSPSKCCLRCVRNLSVAFEDQRFHDSDDLWLLSTQRFVCSGRPAVVLDASIGLQPLPTSTLQSPVCRYSS